MKTVKVIFVGFIASIALISTVVMLSGPKPVPQKEVSDEAWRRVDERIARRREAAEAVQRAAFEEKLKHYGSALQDYARHHPETEEFLDAAASRKVRIGMPAELVEMAWGRPVRRNDTITASGTRSQWVWVEGQYAYIEDGVCTGIQTSH